MKNFTGMTKSRGGNLQVMCLPFVFLLLPIFFLTVKSWFNVLALFIGLISLYELITRPVTYFSNRDKLFWVLTLALLLPFACEVVIQILRDPFTYKALDGPLRFLLGAIVFVFLTRYERTFLLAKFFMRGCLIATFITFLSVFFIQDHFWSSRAATYFVDPNSLPVYMGVLTCMSLYYVNSSGVKKAFKYVSYLCLILMYLYVCHASQTRTSWLPALILLVTFTVGDAKAKWNQKILVLLVSSFITLFFYHNNSVFKMRVDDVISAVGHMTNGNYGTSSLSIRINIFLAEIELIKMKPIFGFEDGVIPSYDILSQSSHSLDHVAYYYLKNAGSHTEVTAQLVRKGLMLGSLTILAIFIFPAFFFFRLRKHLNPEVRILSKMACLVVLILFISSFGIQVFNLKMYSTFWAIFLALFYSVMHRSLVEQSTST